MANTRRVGTITDQVNLVGNTQMQAMEKLHNSKCKIGNGIRTKWPIHFVTA